MFAKEILAKYPKAARLIDGIFLFGSAAANLAMVNSDIDIFCVVEKNAEKFRIIYQKSISAFENKHQVKLNFQSFHTSDFMQFLEGGQVRSFGLEKVLKIGCIPIYLNENRFPKNKRDFLFTRLHPTRESIKQRYGKKMFGLPDSKSIAERLKKRGNRKGNRRFI